MKNRTCNIRPFAKPMSAKQEESLAVMRAIFHARPGREQRAAKRALKRFKAARKAA